MMIVVVMTVATIVGPAIPFFPFEVAPGVFGLSAAFPMPALFPVQFIFCLANAVFAILCHRWHNAANEQKCAQNGGTQADPIKHAIHPFKDSSYGNYT
jgi:membrane protein implicated in regulation of membrane protease activity